MNINLEKLYAEMKDRPWDGDIQSLLTNLRSKRLTGNFPIPFVKVKMDKKCGIAQLPREDFPVFGIDPKNDSFDLVLCSKCNTRYRLQNVEKHLAEHSRAVRSQLVESPESSSSSQPNTPTKASKKEKPKIPRKFVLSPPDVVTPVDIMLSDADISSSSGDNSYPSDGSNMSSNGLVVSVKTELEASVSVNSNPISVNFSTSNSGIQTKSKPVVEKPKKSSPKDISKDKKTPAASKIKEFDPNRHCGVRTEENGWTPCLRSLTCKPHPISLRRAVQGRDKSFDELLLEYKQAKGLYCKATSSKSSKKKPVPKEAVVILHPMTTALVQLTPLPSPVHSPPQYGPPTPQFKPSTPQYKPPTPQYKPPTPQYKPPTPQYAHMNSPATSFTSTQIEASGFKYEPMIVEEIVEDKPVQRFEFEDPIPLDPLPVVDCTTRVRRTRAPPQPLGISRVSLVIHNNRVFSSAREAYWMKLLNSNMNNKALEQSALKNGPGRLNTININSLKNNLHPAQFFNLMSASGQNGSFLPLNSLMNSRYDYNQRGGMKQEI